MTFAGFFRSFQQHRGLINMTMTKRGIALAALTSGAAFFSAPTFADDDLSLYGYTGLIGIPTAEVTPYGSFELQYNEDKLLDRNDVEDSSNLSFSVGLANRFELGGRLSYSEHKGGSYFRNDLSANTKVVLWEQPQLKIAAGWSDFSGESGGTQKFEARYLVGTWSPRQDIDLTVGYGTGPERLDGVFGGVSWTPWKQTQFMLDYDGEFTQAGVRLSYDYDDLVRAYGVVKNNFGFSENSAGAYGGFRFNMFGPREHDDWVDDADDVSPGYGLRFAQVGKQRSDGTPVVRAENAVYMQRQVDMLPAACGLVSGGGEAEIRQYRYGIPLVSSMVDCDTGEIESTNWLATWGKPKVKWGLKPYYPAEIELRGGLEYNSFVGTEYGRHDYSAAAQGSIRFQTRWGLAYYRVFNDRFAQSEDFDEGHVYDFYAVRNGLRESAFQYAFHPFNPVIGVATAGNTWVNNIRYDFTHVETAVFLGDGRHELRGVWAKYDAEQGYRYPDRKLKVITYSYWSSYLGTLFEVGHGEYFYGDKGNSIRATRYFGDFGVQLFVKRKDSNEQYAGITISVPLTPRKSLHYGPVSVVGMPRYYYSRTSSFGNDETVNILRPNLGVEPRPVYNLRTDWLDGERLTPAFVMDQQAGGN